MSASFSNAAASREVRTMDSVRRVPAKASLESPLESSAVQSGHLDGLMAIVESSLLDAHGSQKAAAIEVGCDPSQLKRQIRLGTFDFRQASAAGDAFLAKLGASLTAHYGSSLKSPRRRAIEKVAAMQRELADLQLALGLEE